MSISGIMEYKSDPRLHVNSLHGDLLICTATTPVHQQHRRPGVVPSSAPSKVATMGTSKPAALGALCPGLKCRS